MGNDSFIDLIDDKKELKRVLDGYVFAENSNIKNFEEFEEAFRSAFNSPKGKNTGLTTDKIIKFFETSEVKNRIRDNTTKEEYQEAYGDGHIVEYESPRDRKVIIISLPKIESKGYTRKGKPVRRYSRAKPSKYTPAQEKFIKVRVQKGYKPARITKEYNSHFSQNPRTASSIKTKSYRV